MYSIASNNIDHRLKALAVFLYYFHDNTVISHVVFPWKWKKKTHQCRYTVQDQDRRGPVWEKEIHYSTEMNHSSFEGDLGLGGYGQERGQATIAGKSHSIEGLSRANQRGLWTDSSIRRDSSGQTSLDWRISVCDAKSRCQFDASWVRGEEKGAKQRLIIYSRLFTHDRLIPSWGVNNMAWPQLSSDAAQLLHLLHSAAPDSAFKNIHTVRVAPVDHWMAPHHVRQLFGYISPD